MGDRGPVLGLDLGSKRIGLAVSDADARIAFPAGALASRGRAANLKALCEMIAERGITRVVVGLPIHLSGRPSAGSNAAAEFAEALAAATGLPVDLIDERWTTQAADQSLRESKRGRKRRSEAIDSVAATLCFRTYLEHRESHSDAGPR